MKEPFTRRPFFQRFIHPVLARIPGYDYWLLRRKSMLMKSGWFRSFRTGKSVDNDGNPIPWFTYGAIEMLERRIEKGADLIVFEYGCGLGTLWWAERATRVYAVEHEPEWLDAMKKVVPEHVFLLHSELGDAYVKEIAKPEEKYDVIIIDGRNRVACACEAIKHVSERGVIIFDDSGRKKYSEGIKELEKAGFRRLRYSGLSPIEFMPCETSVFYKDGNVLGI